MKQTYETGLNGELAAEEYLRKQFGMIPLARRHRTRAGEIDLILLDDETVVFAEVKTRRTGSQGEGLSAVNGTKQHRIARAAMLFLMKRGWTDRAVRFDVVEVRENEILYVPNAFQPGGVFFG